MQLVLPSSPTKLGEEKDRNIVAMILIYSLFNKSLACSKYW